MSDLKLPWSYGIEDGAIRDSAHNVVIESVNPFIGEKIVVAMNVKAICDEIIAYDEMSRDVADQLVKLAEEMQAGMAEHPPSTPIRSIVEIDLAGNVAEIRAGEDGFILCLNADCMNPATIAPRPACDRNDGLFDERRKLKREGARMTWTERIIVAKQVGYFTDFDKEAAGEWLTDPCGEKVATLPERKRSWIAMPSGVGGAPYDDDLKRFCWEFQDAVDRDDPYLAGELQDLIHRKIDELAEKIA